MVSGFFLRVAGSQAASATLRPLGRGATATLRPLGRAATATLRPLLSRSSSEKTLQNLEVSIAPSKNFRLRRPYNKHNILYTSKYFACGAYVSCIFFFNTDCCFIIILRPQSRGATATLRPRGREATATLRPLSRAAAATLRQTEKKTTGRNSYPWICRYIPIW